MISFEVRYRDSDRERCAKDGLAGQLYQKMMAYMYCRQHQGFHDIVPMANMTCSRAYDQYIYSASIPNSYPQGQVAFK